MIITEFEVYAEARWQLMLISAIHEEAVEWADKAERSALVRYDYEVRYPLLLRNMIRTVSS